MAWNSKSSPSGVVISMTLGMVHSCLCRLRAADDEAAHGIAGLEAQLRRTDFRLQVRLPEHALDVGPCVTVPPVQADAVPGGRLLLVGFLDGEDQSSARPKRRGGRLGHLLERSKVHEGVSRDYHVEGRRRLTQVL